MTNTLRPDAAALLTTIVRERKFLDRGGIAYSTLTSDERFGFEDLRVAGLAQVGPTDDVVRATARGCLAIGA